MTIYVHKQTGKKYKAVRPMDLGILTSIPLNKKTYVYIEKPSLFLQPYGENSLIILTLEELNQYFTRLDGRNIGNGSTEY